MIKTHFIRVFSISYIVLIMFFLTGYFTSERWKNNPSKVSEDVRYEVDSDTIYVSF